VGFFLGWSLVWDVPALDRRQPVLVDETRAFAFHFAGHDRHGVVPDGLRKHGYQVIVSIHQHVQAEDGAVRGDGQLGIVAAGDVQEFGELGVGVLLGGDDGLVITDAYRSACGRLLLQRLVV